MRDPAIGDGRALAQAVLKAYELGQMDYNLKALVFTDVQGNPVGTVNPGDSMVFCCRRGEREIELTEMFTDPNFSEVERTWVDDLTFVTLTQYHDKFAHLPTAFAPITVEDTLAECISRAGKTQLHSAESEKFAHVTFFLNGGVNQPFEGESCVLVPSLRGVSFDEHPKLCAPEVTDKVIEGLGQNDFIVLNYANGDVIGHSNKKDAKLAAIECVSEQLGRLATAAMEKDYVVLVTADHGNIEILEKPDGTPHVAHTTNLVPFVLADPRGGEPAALLDGSLCDIAPTVLSIMGIEKPAAMTGKNLAPGHAFGEDRKVLLVIVDGFGIGSQDDNDAVHMANTPFWDAFCAAHPKSKLHASSSYVGLGEGKSGNSEAGHLNIGAGRIVAQDDCRIDAAIADGTFQKNEAILHAIESAKKRGTALHLLGLLSKNSSHGSIDYLLAVCDMAKADVKDIYLHLIVDGRSSEAGVTPAKVVELAQQLDKMGAGVIVGCVGRGFALDRDRNFDKVKVAYDAMVLGEGMRYGIES